MEISRRRFCLASLTLPLAGCLQPPPPPPELAPLSYAARRDGGHVVPAVPIEQIPQDFHRQIVPLASEFEPGTLIVDTGSRHIYLLLEDDYALRYGIGVGREGFGWTGASQVFARRSWPTWTPPPEMIKRQPELARWAEGQPGGPRNPLGARAIYLAVDGRDTGYRIHGTPEWQSIGQAASSGCFRMINHDVIDLFDRVRAGTSVIVV
ncbi:L,D-transpeptidase [Plastorhodobacter daqingensis]|uniref:L,D-transpeptidase n=1 Tax=Plastorhodobacter daqingensis TaxID=1387281 RepID=A0ABW2UHB2_9RHOB